MTKFGLAAECGVIVDEFIAALRSSDTIIIGEARAGALEQIRMVDMILSMLCIRTCG